MDISHLNLEEIRPAFHRAWIREGKMTKEESDRILIDWKVGQFIKKQNDWIRKELEREWNEDRVREELTRLDEDDPSKEYLHR